MKDKSKEVEMLKVQLEDIQARLKAIVSGEDQAVNDEVKTYVEEASRNMKEYVDKASAVLKEQWDVTKDGAKETGKKVQNYAQDNPWHIAAASALIGMAIASMLRREKD